MPLPEDTAMRDANRLVAESKKEKKEARKRRRGSEL